MADIAFHHGTRVFESLESPVLGRTRQSAVIAHIGTAPNADAVVFPLNKPILIKGKAEYSIAAALGSAGTLKDSLDASFDQIATYNYVIRVAEGASPAETLSNLVGDGPTLTGVHALKKCESLYGRNIKPRMVVVPGFTAPLGENGIATLNITAPGASYETAPTVHVYPANATKAVNSTADGDNAGNGAMTLDATPYGAGIVAGDYRVECVTAAANGGTFNVIDPSGNVVGQATVGVAYAGPIKFTIADGATDFAVGDGFTVSVAITGGDGVGAVVEATVLAGVVSQLIIRKPGWGYTNGIAVAFSGGGGSGAAASATAGTVANPVIAELVGILETLRAIGYVDGPDTTDAAAVLWRQTINSDRIYPIDVKHMVWDTDLNAEVTQPASSRFVGVQAKVDREQGFWWSLSNKPINGIIGVSRPISYGDQANYLNENHVNTTINMGDGFITWGNRVATSIDLNKFVSVRRTMDFINEALEDAYLEFVDKPFSLANLKFMIESGNAFMKVLRAEGAILNGKVWLDPERNTNEEMAQGRVTLGVDFEPPAPMEDIRLIQHRNITYYAELRNRVLEEIRSGALAFAA
ncbi:MAG: phage tail sheath subtilisin-like domain-containing protein [Hyphomicrobium sp.]